MVLDVRAAQRRDPGFLVPTSALIARGSDFPGNFSHIAFVYVDTASQEAMIVEAHIETGVVVSTVEQYRGHKITGDGLQAKLGCPKLVSYLMLPDKPRKTPTKGRSGAMGIFDGCHWITRTMPSCSARRSHPRARRAVRCRPLGRHIPHLLSLACGVGWPCSGWKHFETQEPSDLEYVPQMRVVAEWRDPATLKQDRIDNAVTDVMLEGAEQGDDLDYQGICGRQHVWSRSTVDR